MVVLPVAAPGMSALQARNQIATALVPGITGLPAAGGEPQSGNADGDVGDLSIERPNDHLVRHRARVR